MLGREDVPERALGMMHLGVREPLQRASVVEVTYVCMAVRINTHKRQMFV